MRSNESTGGLTPARQSSIALSTTDSSDKTSRTHWSYGDENQADRSRGITNADVQTVFEALLDELETRTGWPTYVSSRDLVDDVSFDCSRVGLALKQLSQARDCPLRLTLWSSETTAGRMTWTVEPRGGAD